jgi:hypothetical protein
VGYAEHYGQSAPEVKGCFAQGSNGSKTRKNATSQLEGSGIEPWDVAHAGCKSERNEEYRELEKTNGRRASDRPGRCSKVVAYAERERLEIRQGQAAEAVFGTELDGGKETSQWSTEPSLGRVADGVPHRVDRLRALGNAVVPQVAEFIGRRIMETEGVNKEKSNEW